MSLVRQQSRRSRQNRLSLESLESRELFAADFGASALDSSPAAVAPAAAFDTALTAELRSGRELYIDGSDYRDVVITQPMMYGRLRVTLERFDGDQSLGVRTYNFTNVSKIEFHGRGGDDMMVNYANLALKAYGNDGNDYLSQKSNGEAFLVGGEGNDVMLGGGGLNQMIGNNGNDSMTGGSGTNWMYGGDGDDFMYGGNRQDFMYGENGNDTMHGYGGDDLVNGGEGNDLLWGDAGRDNVVGEGGDDVMHGDNYQLATSGGGADRMEGGKGNDIMYGEFGNDLMMGGEGDDLMYGGYGDDTMLGDDGADRMSGQQGNDRLDGGYDTAIDQLWGELGADTFVRHKTGNILDTLDLFVDFQAFQGDRAEVVTHAAATARTEIDADQGSKINSHGRKRVLEPRQLSMDEAFAFGGR